MIGNQVKGRNFRKLLNYLLSKDEAVLIGSNMEGTTVRELAAEFRFSQHLNPRVSRVVYHASLSLPPGEQLANHTWHEMAQKYLQAMGFDMNQYVVVRHSDRAHDHAHIVASRIRLDGTTVCDRWDYRRSEAVIRQLEQEYDLRSLYSPNQAEDNRNSKIESQRLLTQMDSKVDVDSVAQAMTTAANQQNERVENHDQKSRLLNHRQHELEL